VTLPCFDDAMGCVVGEGIQTQTAFPIGRGGGTQQTRIGHCNGHPYRQSQRIGTCCYQALDRSRRRHAHVPLLYQATVGIRRLVTGLVWHLR
jgi:hypothetical protein